MTAQIEYILIRVSVYGTLSAALNYRGSATTFICLCPEMGIYLKVFTGYQRIQNPKLVGFC